jgi:asparagine N-glycosylation enzyme membrane subunit Stt3
MTGASAIFLSILMVAAFLLALGGIHQLVKRKEKKKGILMLVCAAVALGNVLVWTL